MQFRIRRFYTLALEGRIYQANSEDIAVLSGNGFRGFMCFQQTVVFIWGFEFLCAHLIFYSHFGFWDRFSTLMLSWLWCYNVSIPLCRALSCTEQGGYRYGRIQRTEGMLVLFDNTTYTIHCRLGSSTSFRNYCEGILLRLIMLTHYFTDVMLMH